MNSWNGFLPEVRPESHVTDKGLNVILGEIRTVFGFLRWTERSPFRLRRQMANLSYLRHKRRRIRPIGGETASFPLRHPGVESHPVNKGIRITRRGGSSITYCARVMMRFCYPREGVYGVSSVESRMPPSCSSNDAPSHWVHRLRWSIKVPVYQPGFGTKRMGSKR